jgi:hypothetical protein
MANAAGFIKRLTGPNRIAWSPEDLDRLRKIYGLTEKQAEEVLQRHAPRLCAPLDDVKKNSAGDMPTRWRFTASDGKVDRVGDVISVAGIALDDYRANPIWHYGHDFSMPVGMAPDTSKQAGNLKSTLDLGIGIFPYAEVLQRALVAGFCRACSVGFEPKRWSYNKERDGVDFYEINLIEISAVTVPCCAGAVLDGPVKQLSRLSTLKDMSLSELVRFKPENDRERESRKRWIDVALIKMSAAP